MKPDVTAKAILAPPAGDEDWRVASLAALTRHIQCRYHEPLYEELPRLAELFAEVLWQHGEAHVDLLVPLSDAFHVMANEVLNHLRKEEAVLFPAIVALEAAVAARDGLNHGDWTWIRQPLLTLKMEHAFAAAKLRTMRHRTGGYTPPDGASAAFRELFQGLERLERDLSEHMAIENEILFPRAVALAQADGPSFTVSYAGR